MLLNPITQLTWATTNNSALNPVNDKAFYLMAKFDLQRRVRGEINGRCSITLQPQLMKASKARRLKKKSQISLNLSDLTT